MISLKMMGSNGEDVITEILPFIRVYKDGSIERLAGSPIVPPSASDPETGVSSKDIIVSENPPLSARIYLPKEALGQQHRNKLAPEHPLPTAYDDCWAGLQAVVSYSNGDSNGDSNREPWLSTYVDFGRVYVGGDSAGANLAHHILMRAGTEGLHGGVKIKGAFLTHPYFWGSKPVGSETTDVAERENLAVYAIWKLVYPEAPGGIDNPMINPVVAGAPSLGGLGCSRLLVSVAEKDVLRDRGIMYCNAVKESGWKGELELAKLFFVSHKTGIFG
ncbi:hypothetical protein V6N13_040829 [Hibiscus sabdariffa]|uniref:Alpha/beta hydrolase fold-3 domain-containing protein n=1 Tax=Hibiscus sabdariffa TaxID=183260 RepID=A0ABR2R9V1_9ROSI